jgi:putative toxin-antitoxin system antitoxin component (TIGR02293 family)
MTAADILEVLGGAAAGEREARSGLDLVRAVQDGLPLTAIRAVVDRGVLTIDEVERLVIPRRTLQHRRARGERLSVAESDRLARIARVSAAAAETFQNQEKASHWLRRPNRSLGDSAPLDLLATGEGSRLVEDVLVRISHGVYG